MSTEVVDLTFPVKGRLLAYDHGYAVYGALSRLLPELHQADWLAIAPIRGRQRLGGWIRIEPWSALILRMPPTHIPKVLPLSGQILRVDDSTLVLGTPRVEPLRPSPSLSSRMAVVRLTRAPRTANGIDKPAMAEAVRAELERQLAALRVSGRLVLGRARELTVGRQRIIGWPTQVHDLSHSHSLELQAHGLGGKRRMGCGVFVPLKPAP